ncbi:MAG: ribonuclease D, partial [Parvibaculum sp.]
VLLAMRCEENDVAQKLIAKVSDLEQIAAYDDALVPAMNGWRREVFGNDAMRLKRGEISLSAKGRKIILIENGKN